LRWRKVEKLIPGRPRALVKNAADEDTLGLSLIKDYVTSLLHTTKAGMDHIAGRPRSGIFAICSKHVTRSAKKSLSFAHLSVE